MSQKLFYKYDRNAKSVLPLDLYAVGYAYCDPHYRIKKRTPTINKSSVQIMWFTKGKALVLQQGTFSQVKKNQVTIVPPGVKANFRTENSSCEFWSVIISGFAASIIVNGLGLDIKKPIKAGPCPEDKMKELQEGIQKIVSFNEYRNSLILYDLLLHLKNAPSLQTGNPNDMDSQVKQALRLVDHNYAAPNICVNELCDILKVSRPTFLKLFKTETGITPKEYLDAKRFQKIVKLLQSTEHSIAEIAFRTGFRDPNYMSKFFRKKMGKSPQEFRISPQ